jgi:hypothetical protein
VNNILKYILILLLFSCNGKENQTKEFKSNSNETKKYKNVLGGTSKHLSTCKTCGTSYTIETLPYGEYCSKNCYNVYN